jgi:hypothetical protein
MISFLGISDLSLLDTPFKDDNPTMVASSKYWISYSATLYNTSLRGRGGFYGRTYTTDPKLLGASMTNIGVLESKEVDYVYFHTNYTEKTSMLVVEIVVTREFN